MSIDDADPSCPECGEPVGTNASYCMHCGAEFDFADGVEDDGGGLLDSIIDAIDGTTDESPDVESTAATVENEQGGTVGTATDTTAGTSETADTAGATRDRTGPQGGPDTAGAVRSGGPADAGTGGTASGTGASGGTSEGGSLLDPDGLLDNSLTVLVGIGAGVVIGLISLFVFGIAFGGTGVLLAFVAWLGSTAYLARRRTVFDAVRDGAFGLAAVLVIAGIGASVGTAMGGNSALAAVGVLLPFAFFAVLVAGTGYAIGTLGVE